MPRKWFLTSSSSRCVSEAGQCPCGASIEADEQDVDAQTATVRSLDFKTSFKLNITENSTIRAFLTHFDTFFSRDGRPTSRPVDISHYEDDEFEKTVEPTDAEVSFTTGPRGQSTHWKQVGFLIPEAIVAQKGKSAFEIRTRMLLKDS